MIFTLDSEKIGKLIKKIRRESNLTQEKFASIYGVTYQAVSKWETGKSIPDISILKRICEDYNYDLNTLLNGDEENKAKNKKRTIAIIVVIIVFIALAIFTINHFDNPNDFNFKTLKTTCDDFDLFGSIAYNNSKTSIYISNISYCGDEKSREYEKLECTLYEKNENTKTKISSNIYDDGKNITLGEFLNDVIFKVDEYSQTCKNYKDNGLVLEIVATTNENKSEFYEIPLSLEENCD